MAKTSWVIVTFDTDGEVIFAMASILTHQDFQRSTKYELRAFPTSPAVSLLVIQGHYSVIATSE
jgi:hypothetical protein